MLVVCLKSELPSHQAQKIDQCTPDPNINMGCVWDPDRHRGYIAGQDIILFLFLESDRANIIYK